MPRPVQGFRVVKARTERQQQHAHDYSHRPESVMVIHSADAGLPADSWWTQPGNFAERARVEQKRMELSRFGRTRDIVL